MIVTRLARARRMAGLTQRELAVRAGVPQSTVARIETGALDPRTRTIERLLQACGMELDVSARPGAGVDRGQLRERLDLTPRERIEQTAAAAMGVARFRGKARRGH